MKKQILTSFVLLGIGALVLVGSPTDVSAQYTSTGRCAESDCYKNAGNTKTTATRTSVSADSNFSALLADLLKKVKDLQKEIQDLRKGGGSHSTSTATSTPNSRGDKKWCKEIPSTGGYGRGMSGDGVKKIQHFLRDEGDLDDDSLTGYFGEKTERALGAWQEREGVSVRGMSDWGKGKFGDKTRNAIFRRCNDEKGEFKLSPETGTAPLTVEVAGLPNAVLKKMDECKTSQVSRGGDRNGLTVDWGDGTVSPVIGASSTVGASCKNEVKKHIYKNPGTYTAKVKIWHAGPTDAPVTDWEGTAKVVVKATSTVEGPRATSTSVTRKARKALAEKLDVKASSILVVAIEAKEWTDGCLGLGGPAESCLAAITPGFKVTLKKGDTTYYARTNSTGTVVRFES